MKSMYCITCGTKLVFKSRRLNGYNHDSGVRETTSEYVCPVREEQGFFSRLFHPVCRDGAGERYTKLMTNYEEG